MISKARQRLIGRLRTRRGRPREGLFLVEGIRGVEEALAAGAEISFAVVSPRLEISERGRELAVRLRERGVDLESVGHDRLEELSDTETPQGVLLVCVEPACTLSDLSSGPGRGVLVLDAVQDPGNLGTLVRAAKAFGLKGVLALDGTVDPWNPKAVRAAAGASLRLPLLKEGWDRAWAWIRAEEIRLLVADAEGIDVAEEEAGTRWALVVGNEGSGAREGVLDVADRAVSVPMEGGAESLNAGVAGAILLYALSRGTRS